MLYNFPRCGQIYSVSDSQPAGLVIYRGKALEKVAELVWAVPVERLLV